MNRFLLAAAAALYLACSFDGPIARPNPSPAPPPKVSFLYLIHESGDTTPASGAVRNAKAWRDVLDKAGVRWTVLDKDEAAKAFPNATQKAIAVGLPAVVGIDANNRATVEKAPASVEAMVKLARKYAGVSSQQPEVRKNSFWPLNPDR